MKVRSKEKTDPGPHSSEESEDVKSGKEGVFSRSSDYEIKDEADRNADINKSSERDVFDSFFLTDHPWDDREEY